MMTELLILEPAQAVAVSMVVQKDVWRVSLWQAGSDWMLDVPDQANLDSRILRNDDTALPVPVRMDRLRLYRQNQGWTIWTERQCLIISVPDLTRRKTILMNKTYALRLAEQWKQKYQPALFLNDQAQGYVSWSSTGRSLDRPETSRKVI